ncbi:MAG: metalloregulator ArsR/SmtB family transcription factor [Firmicutes bacterium]|nr:metalloregulator ArsR/SmtB family transcription factor [Bacillota bacterium]
MIRPSEGGVGVDEMERRIPEVDGISGIFRILGNETRCRIVYLLSFEELCTCHLAEVLDITMPAVSHHLRLLKAHRLVKTRPEGKHVYYSLADDHVVTLIRVAQEHYEEEGLLGSGGGERGDEQQRGS